MPPTRGRGRRRESLTRITRSRTNASDPRGIPDTLTSSATVSAMGQPPPQCLESVDFDDDPGLRAVVSGTRTTWERSIESRIRANEKVVGEIHAMLVEMRPASVVAPAALGSAAQLVDTRPVPAASSAPAALGSAAQAFDEVSAGHSAPQPIEIPWPTMDTYMPGTTEGMGSLPETAQNLMMAGSSYSLPLDAQIPESLRSKIWSGDFVDLSLLLKPTQVQHQDYTLSVNSGATQPTFCVSPAKPKAEPLSFERWVQAFQLYMSVYLLAPANALLAVKMLKYMEVIRRLAEQGGNWLSYDEVFRSLRCSRGWAWDYINWELWFRAAQEKATVTVRQTSGSPFQVKGKAKVQSQGNCYPFNRGEMCNKDTCRYWHKCSFCQGSHPFVHCYKAQGTRQRPNQQRPNQQRPNQQRQSQPPTPGSPSGPTAWSKK